MEKTRRRREEERRNLPRKMVRMIQGNVNHSGLAQDLLIQRTRERRADVVGMVEPHSINDRDRRSVSDVDGTAVLIINDERPFGCILERIRGKGYAAVVTKEWTICVSYFSPNGRREAFEGLLGSMERRLGHRTVNMVIMADWNARRRTWGDRASNVRGSILEEWASGMGLLLLNEWGAVTCRRPQGESGVDQTWVRGGGGENREWFWRVDWKGGENTSDHYPLEFGFRERKVTNRSTHLGWRRETFKEEHFSEALEVGAWPEWDSSESAEGQVARLTSLMTDACDAAMRRRRGREGTRRCAYWWNGEIGLLRESALASRRRLTRSRRRGARVPSLERKWRESRKELKGAILAAKKKAWQEMLESTNVDPWGKPYKLVRDKLIREPPPLDSMTIEEAEETVDDLFPRDEEGFTPVDWRERLDNREWEETHEVSVSEVRRALKRASRGGGRAPGPDGITSVVWRRVAEAMPETVARVLSKCLRDRTFPREWKNGRLVLIRKPGKVGKFRPLCLIDEGAKLLERIVAGRMWKRINEIKERYKGIAPRQFGFRRGRSTIHAMNEMERIIEQGEDKGLTTVIISIDIKNAFNTLNWRTIAEALARNGFPGYLGGIVLSYLEDRRITFTARDGISGGRKIDRGVPQGSALGPLLWILSYDPIMNMRDVGGLRIIGFADDTLFLMQEEGVKGLRKIMISGIHPTIRKLGRMGLEIAPEKTQAMVIGEAAGDVEKAEMELVEGSKLTYGDSIKYLGVHIDRGRTFAVHVRRTAEKASGVAMSLARLMPNLRGPIEARRKLYVNVVYSIILYGVPFWGRRVKKTGLAPLKKATRTILGRLTAAYCTVSLSAVELLAAVPPLDLLIDEATNRWRKREETMETRAVELRRIDEEERRTVMERWVERTRDSRGAAVRVRKWFAAEGAMDGWSRLRNRRTDYHMTQLMTGHGCFAAYLHKIGRATRPSCWFCEEPRDDAEHTAMTCQRWEEERTTRGWVDRETRPDWDNLIEWVLKGNGRLEELATFAGEVMKKKEEREREMEAVLERGETAPGTAATTLVRRRRRR